MSDAAASGGSSGGAPAAAPAAAPSAPASAPAAPQAGPAPVPAAPANENGAPPEPKHRVKVGGEEREYTVAELARLAEKGHGAEQRFREAAEVRKRTESFTQELQANPVAALAKLMKDKSKAAKTIVAQLMNDPETREILELDYLERAKYEGLPAEERRRVDEDRALREKAARADEYERRQNEAHQQQMTAQYETQFADMFGKALTAAGVGVDDDSIGWMAFYAERAIASREQVTPAQLAERVKAKMGGRVPDVKAMTAEQIEALLSEEQRAELRKRDVERLKAKAAPIERTTPARAPNGQFVAANDNSEPPRKESTSRFFQRIRGER